MNKKDRNRKHEDTEKTTAQSIKEWIGVIVTAVIIAAVVVQFIRPTRVDGDSMYSTLENNDYLIINTMKYRFSEPEKGDIIIFDTDTPLDPAMDMSTDSRNILKKGIDFVLGDDSRTKDLVKRVIAEGGDRVQISDGKVWVNEELIEEPYLDPGMTTEGEIDVIVPENTFFVMGDNRTVSLDSRYAEVGFISKDKIMGEVMFRLLPVSSIGTVK
ncbi:signal peptidase I [Peptacetobacter hominis]|uniref:signal peptidase I n=1 Tax=Peptacetobacter hominis TaxID=2743610 RepID=UPI001583F756|nr:signal peptidase I [Peptacetobacter hominis]